MDQSRQGDLVNARILVSCILSSRVESKWMIVAESGARMDTVAHIPTPTSRVPRPMECLPLYGGECGRPSINVYTMSPVGSDQK
jgi:hypothetical protein